MLIAMQIPTAVEKKTLAFGRNRSSIEKTLRTKKTVVITIK